MAFCELWMMRAATPEQFGTALRWLHVPGWVIIVALVGFVQLHLRAGRSWLAWTVCGLARSHWSLTFCTGPNLNYLEVTVCGTSAFLGETVSVAEGVSNPWMLVGQASFVLLAVFRHGCHDSPSGGGATSGGAGDWAAASAFIVLARSAGRAGTLGDRPLADDGELILHGYRRVDSLRYEP